MYGGSVENFCGWFVGDWERCEWVGRECKMWKVLKIIDKKIGFFGSRVLVVTWSWIRWWN